MYRKNATLLAAALAAPLMALPTFAVDLTSSIVNANADVAVGPASVGGVLLDGQDEYTNTSDPTIGWKSWASSDNGNQIRLWNPSATDRSSTQNNQFFDYGWLGLDGSGNPDGGVIAVRTQAYDYVQYSGATGPWDSFGNRLWNVRDNDTGDGDPALANYSWRQDSGGVWGGSSWTGGVRDFEAAAQVIAESFDPTAKYTLTVSVGRLAEGTGPNYDGSSLNAGSVTFTGATSTRFANDAPATWSGYEVALMAGGVEGQNSLYGGWVYGTTANTADADYIGTLASDSSQQAGLAQDSWGTSTVTYLPGSVDTTGLAGDNLVIRLAALESANHQETQTAAFDSVTLTKIMAGDANEDDKVSCSDRLIVLANLGSSGGWNDGDFDGDGDVDADDLALLDGNYGFSGTVPFEDLDGDGDVDGVDISEMFSQFNGPGGGTPTNPDADLDCDGDLDGVDLSQMFSAFTGPLAPATVPEPASLALIGLGGLLFARRRR